MNLIINAQGKYIDQQSGAVFKGVVPRDLNVLDTFQVSKIGVIHTFVVTQKEVDEDEMLIIQCNEVEN